MDRTLLTNKVESNVHLSSQFSDQLLQHFVPNVSSANQMLTHTRYNAICKLKVFNKYFKYSRPVSICINCSLRQSKRRKSKMFINCSEMTVNYIVMHCITLHYTVEYTVAHCSSANKTRPNKVAGM